MKHCTLSLAIITCITLLTLPACAAAFTGQVIGVVDGDTIDVLHNDKAERVRLCGIDCPEKRQAFGKKAKRFTSDLVFRKTVTVIVKDHDRYGRTIGAVILPNGKSLNHELVRAGYAWWYRKYAPKDFELMILQDNSRKLSAGLWADANPVAPWECIQTGWKERLKINGSGVVLTSGRDEGGLVTVKMTCKGIAIGNAPKRNRKF